jgi:cytochrome c oxidase assembly protein subunit 15
MEHKKHHIIYWLGLSAFMVFSMAVIGAITRLTESGLSMVEWRPLIGALPPLSDAEWNRVFALYQESPEFEKKHFWMELPEFKKIFFWEWFHRFWGRLIGLVFAIPLIYFWLSKKIPEGYGLRFLGLLFLGGAQGVVGWWMVKSGLVDRPDVSHFRLAAHLGLAYIIFGLLCATAYRYTHDIPAQISLLHYAGLFMILLTVIWGAFVAGLEAGRVYNSFPAMADGSLFPDGKASLHAIFYDHGWVQFVHRWIAKLTAVILCMVAYCYKSPAIAVMVFIQIGLGICTLLTVLWIPLAALHQAGAFILLALYIQSLYVRAGDSR